MEENKTSETSGASNLPAKQDNEPNENNAKAPFRKGYYYNRRRKYINKPHQPRQEKISFKKISIVVPSV